MSHRGNVFQQYFIDRSSQGKIASFKGPISAALNRFQCSDIATPDGEIPGIFLMDLFTHIDGPLEFSCLKVGRDLFFDEKTPAGFDLFFQKAPLKGKGWTEIRKVGPVLRQNLINISSYLEVISFKGPISTALDRLQCSDVAAKNGGIPRILLMDLLTNIDGPLEFPRLEFHLGLPGGMVHLSLDLFPLRQAA